MRRLGFAIAISALLGASGALALTPPTVPREEEPPPAPLRTDPGVSNPTGPLLRDGVARELERAQTALKGGRNLEAKILLETTLLRIDLTNVEVAIVREQLGYVHLSGERFADAIAAFEAAIKSQGLPKSRQSDVLYRLGELYAATGDAGSAIRVLDVWLKSAPRPKADALFLIASAHAVAKRFDDALAFSERGLKAGGTMKSEWLELAVALYERRDTLGKIPPLLKRLIEQRPFHLPYWRKLAEIYDRMGESEKGRDVRALMLSLGLYADPVEVVRLVQADIDQGLPREALAHLDQALGLGIVEETFDVLRLRAAAHLGAREPHRAIDPLTRAADLDPTGETDLLLGRTLIEIGSFAAAERVLEQSLPKLGLARPGRAWLLIGIACLHLDKVDEARLALAEAGRDPDLSAEAAEWSSVTDRIATMGASLAARR